MSHTVKSTTYIAKCSIYLNNPACVLGDYSRKIGTIITPPISTHTSCSLGVDIEVTKLITYQPLAIDLSSCLMVPCLLRDMQQSYKC